MKYAISNIAFPPAAGASAFSRVAAMGFEGLEVAPSRAWQNTWTGLTHRDVAKYRKEIESGGLSPVGLHSLLFDQPHLALCRSEESRSKLLDFFVHLSGVCRDLGGRTLIWGGGRRRGDNPEDHAISIAVEFFGHLADRISDHGTVFCIEPLSHSDTDFLPLLEDCRAMVEHVDLPCLKIQIDAKALAANDELTMESFESVSGNLVHFHANEPGFEVLGSTGTVAHETAGRCLRHIGYTGFVSIEQKLTKPEDVFGPIDASLQVLKRAYR